MMNKRVLYLGLLLSIFVISALAQKFPKPTGVVNDFANIIPQEYERQLEGLSREILQKTGASLVVATFSTIGDEDYNEFANKLYRVWGIGKKGEDKGVLFFITVKERKMRIETGYGLEGVLPDAICAQIRDQYLVPHFRTGDFGRGFLLGMAAAGQRIAKEAGVQLSGPVRQSPRRFRDDYPHRQPRGGVGSWIIKILLGIFFLYMLIRHPRLLFFMLLFSGRGGRGTWSGGGGGFGGGFGGFGGGSSGGGGAGGSW